MGLIEVIVGGGKLFCIGALGPTSVEHELIGPCTMAGNCFGAPFVMAALAEDWIIAGAFAHPTFLDEEHFKKVKSR